MPNAVIGTFLAVQLAGCGTALATPPFVTKQIVGAETPGVADRRTVTVVGLGTVRVPPDLASVTVGVESRAPEASQVQAILADKSQAVISRLQGLGIPTADIQTVGLTLFPEYARPQKTDVAVADKLVGYRGSQRLQVRCRPDQAGPVVDAALVAGANRLQGVAFSLNAITKPRQEAINKATADALDQAQTALGALSMRIVDIRKIDVSSSNTPPRPHFYAGHGRSAAMAMPVSAGEMEVRAQVTVVASF